MSNKLDAKTSIEILKAQLEWAEMNKLIWEESGTQANGLMHILLELDLLKHCTSVQPLNGFAVYWGDFWETLRDYWIDKGLGMIAGGFTPNPLHEVNEYIPSVPEILIALGVWAMGFLVLTLLFKIAVGVKEELRD